MRRVSKDFDAGYVTAKLEEIVKANDASEQRLQTSISNLYKMFDNHPTRREFESLMKQLDGVAEVAREAVEKATSASTNNAITAAGIAPWKALLYALMTMILGAAGAYVGLK